MSLSGLKQLSIISSPPAGRQNVVTQVSQDSDDTVKHAIQQEYRRQGQTYVVAPRIRQLNSLQHRLLNLVPAARYAILHSQLSSANIAHIMQQFDNQQLDVLISSTIIASGLDLPNANTIIVMQATHFGLADLYQLRGRIGRRQRQGYAYFLYSQADLTSVQRQRLAALTEATRLGSGWSLAKRDLAIRGAGNLLGAEQSGTINAIGAQLYLDMIHQATKQQAHYLQRQDVQINLPLPAHIPTSYISSSADRTNLYQSLSRAATTEDLDLLTKQTANQYGPPPLPLNNLVQLIKLQHHAAQANIALIDSQLISPPGQSPFHRITITANQSTYDYQALNLNNQWQVHSDKITRDVSAITPQTINQLLAL